LLGAALMLAIASTHLPPRVGETETIVGLLQRIWDSKTPMASLLKTNDMLPEYLAKVLGKDTEQLGSDEVYSFVKAAFPAAAHRYVLRCTARAHVWCVWCRVLCVVCVVSC
jgi:hypothetical protein